MYSLHCDANLSFLGKKVATCNKHILIFEPSNYHRGGVGGRAGAGGLAASEPLLTAVMQTDNYAADADEGSERASTREDEEQEFGFS